MVGSKKSDREDLFFFSSFRRITRVYSAEARKLYKKTTFLVDETNEFALRTEETQILLSIFFLIDEENVIYFMLIYFSDKKNKINNTPYK